MGKMCKNINGVIKTSFHIFDGDISPITGLILSDFTISLYNPSGIECADSYDFTLDEYEQGIYVLSFSLDIVGVWSLLLIQDTYIPFGIKGEFLIQDAILDHVLSLAHENIYLDSMIFDSNKNMISGRMRTYSDAVSVGSDENVLKTYTIEGDHSADPTYPNLLLYKVMEI